MSRLSSDILEQQFGETKIRIIRSSDTERLIMTETVEGRKVLELSSIKFVSAGVELFPNIHDEIVAGQSMGKAFRDAGVKFVRRQKSFSRCGEDWLSIFKTDGQVSATEVEILVGEAALPYAEILEVYSPAVKWPDQTGASIENLQGKLKALRRWLNDPADR